MKPLSRTLINERKIALAAVASAVVAGGMIAPAAASAATASLTFTNAGENPFIVPAGWRWRRLVGRPRFSDGRYRCVSTAPAPAGSLPSAEFTWSLPAPTTITGATSAVTATTATVNGTVDPNGAQVTYCHFTIVSR